MSRDDFAHRATQRATAPISVPSAVHRLEANRTPAGQGGRWGLVLGGGGVLGTAWLIGALDALERARGIDARDADIVVGTSAGAIVGALISAGMPVAEQRDRQLGVTSSDFDADRAGGPARPPRPRLRPGSPQLIKNNRGALRQLPPLAVLSALAPTGRGRLDDVGRLIERQVPKGQWLSNDRFRCVTLDYDTGRRVVFGEPSEPSEPSEQGEPNQRAGLSEAVVASCSIPGWFEPVTIHGRRYVDGGTWSATNTDLLTGEDLDEVFVLAPMASTAYDTPTDWRVRVERRIRVLSTRRCLREARQVHAAGTTVTVITPGPEELALWGYNLMHPGRRKPLLESATRTTLAALRTLEPDTVRTIDLNDQTSEAETA